MSAQYGESVHSTQGLGVLASVIRDLDGTVSEVGTVTRAAHCGPGRVDGVSREWLMLPVYWLPLGHPHWPWSRMFAAPLRGATDDDRWLSTQCQESVPGSTLRPVSDTSSA